MYSNRCNHTRTTRQYDRIGSKQADYGRKPLRRVIANCEASSRALCQPPASLTKVQVADHSVRGECAHSQLSQPCLVQLVARKEALDLRQNAATAAAGRLRSLATIAIGRRRGRAAGAYLKRCGIW